MRAVLHLSASILFTVMASVGTAAADDKPMLSPAAIVVHPAVVAIKPQAITHPDLARDRLMTDVFKGNPGRSAVFASREIRKAGSRIAGWRPKDTLVVDKDSWLFFIDDSPGANWEHPARYVLMDKDTGVSRIIPTRTPPAELRALQPVSPAAVEHIRGLDLNARTLKPGLDLRPVKIPKKDKYALLVSGGWNADYNYARYWNDIASIYKALKQKYNYTDDEIIVLFANGTHSPNADLDGDGRDDIDYAATKANLTTAMTDIANHLTADGKFFFYSTNHGGQESGQNAILYLWGETIQDNEFADLSKKIKAKEAIYVMEQCYSGGMMDDILNAQPRPCTLPGVCVMSAARFDEVSWAADTEGDYDEYIYHWTAAVFGKTPNGTVVNADSNGDGVVSMAEAHEYAKSHDNQNEHPQIGSCVVNACNASLLAPSSIKEDCIGFNLATTQAVQIGGNWKIVDGSHWLSDFGGNMAEAQKSLAIIKQYNTNQSCFVGRPNPSLKYLLANGAAPAGAIPGEDCIGFNPANLSIIQTNGRWKVVDGSHAMFDFNANRAEAEQALQIIKKHGFTQSCFVGRPQPSLEYLRK